VFTELRVDSVQKVIKYTEKFIEYVRQFYLSCGKLGDERRWLRSGSDQGVHLKHNLQSPRLRTSNPGFNPRFTPLLYIKNVGINPGLNPGFAVLRCAGTVLNS
jgi:hypothetical protein